MIIDYPGHFHDFAGEFQNSRGFVHLGDLIEWLEIWLSGESVKDGSRADVVKSKKLSGGGDAKSYRTFTTLMQLAFLWKVF